MNAWPVVLALALAANAPARPSHQHGAPPPVRHIAPQDEAVVLSGPLSGTHVRVLAIQHKFFDAEPWAECLAIEPDAHGHLHWLLVPACGLERVELWP